MKMYTVSQWVLFFYIYCFLGWVWESAYVSIRKKRLVNRGFMKGPFLPIYGSGALCVLIVTIPVRGNPVLMALFGMAAAGVLEYVTGAVMERLFGVRYWDYTGKFLNLNGYICFVSIAAWGVMTLLVVNVFQARLERLVLALDQQLATALALLAAPILAADFATSFLAAVRLRDLLERRERLRGEMQRLAQKRQELEAAIRNAGDHATGQLLEEVRELMERVGDENDHLRQVYGKSIRGLLLRNPHAVSHLHKEAFAELKQSLMEKIDARMDRIRKEL